MVTPKDAAREILLEELKCAESVKSGAFEIQQLLERGAIKQAEEKLEKRGKIIYKMVELDEQLKLMSEDGLLQEKSKDWGNVVTLAKSLRDITKTIVKVDARTRDQLEKKGREISIKLNKLLDGRKIIRSYSNERNEGISSSVSA